MDNIKGVVHSKDLLNILLYKGIIILQDIVREPYFVYKNQKISEVLKIFRKGHLHLAIVKDESEKIAGVITLEDILEEIIQHEIVDEDDRYIDMRTAKRARRRGESHRKSKKANA